jgi:outer membrane protein
MMMKRLPLILNIILLVAVAVLYVLHFTSHKGNHGMANSDQGTIADVKGPLKVAFINIDSLVSKFSLYKENAIKLTDKQKQIEAELKEKNDKFQKNAMDFQYKINKGLVTTAEAQDIQKNLTDEQQNLYKLRDQLTQDFSQEQAVMNRQMIEAIEKYLKEYTKDHPYHYIFSYSFGQNLLYANDSLEITNDVLVKLNENFKETAKSRK